MGKKTIKSAPDTSVEATSNLAGILLSSFDKSPSAELFAIVTHSVDRHRLRIFSTRSGTVSNDYSAENKERFTSLTWGAVVDNGNLGHPTEVKPGKKRRTKDTIQVVALGTHTGSILIYSLAHGMIVKRLADAHTTPVADFVLNRAGTKGYSIAEDGYIVEWDIEQEKEISKWKANEKNVRRLALSHNESTLAVAGHTIALWNLKDRQAFKKFTGHASLVKQLKFSQEDDLLISIADDDRYVNVWDAQSTNDNINNLTALTLENNAAQIDFSLTEPAVLAVSEDGLVGIWENASSSGVTTGPRHRRKAARATTRQPESNIKVVDSNEEEANIPIISACFVVDHNGKAVMIARGSSFLPSFEVVRFVNEETGALMDDIVLTRKRTVSSLIDNDSVALNNLKTTHKKYNEASIKVIGNTDFTISVPTMDDGTGVANKSIGPSIADKLSEIELEDDQNKSSGDGKPKKKAVAIPSAGSLQQVLVQALHSNDQALLEACLQHTKPEVIRSTVKRLPTSYVIPLMQQLIARFQSKPNRGHGLLEWIRAVLLIHTTYLMTVPDLVGKLSNFYQTLDARLNVFPKLLALRGRLDMIQNQIDTRTRHNKSDAESDNEDSNVYVEQDSDDEAEADRFMSEDDDAQEYPSDDEDMMELEEDEESMQEDSEMESEEED
ncbi:WD40-repeat-containing domain protein [Dichotomocladium elegans]|nr:WD40-repeat-containing domain protein [Dichotomocladium elegans]